MYYKTIAYLIQAHGNPSHLLKLVTKLQSLEVDFFIHVDKKTNIVPFEEELKGIDNVFFVSERVSVVWKWFSQVLASLNLITLALNSKYEYKYFTLISGVDYPIISSQDIVDFFDSQTYNFLEYEEIKESKSYIDYFKNKQLWFKISKWHYYDTLKINWWCNQWSFKHMLYRGYIFLNICILNIFSKKKNIDTTKKYYFWSSWWSLTKESIGYVLDYSKKNPEFNMFMKYCDASDEIYFQTILLNSPYKDICVNDNLRYINWSKDREGPAILVEDDFEEITKSWKIFARKFSSVSRKLIERLNNQ